MNDDLRVTISSRVPVRRFQVLVAFCRIIAKVSPIVAQRVFVWGVNRLPIYLRASDGPWTDHRICVAFLEDGDIKPTVKKESGH